MTNSHKSTREEVIAFLSWIAAFEAERNGHDYFMWLLMAYGFFSFCGSIVFGLRAIKEGAS